MTRALIFLTIFCRLSTAEVFIEEFTGSSRARSSSQVIWNRVLGKLHLPSYIPAATLTGTAEDVALPIGDGSDGIFDPTTFAHFDDNNGAALTATGGTLRLNTGTVAAPRIFKFSSFTLPTGYTIECAGENPLDIRVQGDFSLAGVIDASGGSATGQSAGVGRCGGGDGGRGGDQNLPGEDGETAGSDSQGGAGGAVTPSFTGGSGGSWNVGVDHYVFTLQGASGGGGGSGSSSGVGGGGGAGGGAIRIVAGQDILIHATGEVRALGGDGANGTATALGGGGGLGGVLQFFAYREYQNPVVGETEITTDNLDANGGNSGTSGSNGSGGMTWRNARVHGALGTNDNEPVPLLTGLPGELQTVSGSFGLETGYYDLGLLSSEVVSAAATQSGTTSIVFYASRDGASDATDGLALAQASQLTGFRYFRMGFTLEGESAEIDRVSLDARERKFNLSLGCGRVNRGSGARGWIWVLAAGWVAVTVWVGRCGGRCCFPKPQLGMRRPWRGRSIVDKSA